MKFYILVYNPKYINSNDLNKLITKLNEFAKKCMRPVILEVVASVKEDEQPLYLVGSFGDN